MNTNSPAEPVQPVQIKGAANVSIARVGRTSKAVPVTLPAAVAVNGVVQTPTELAITQAGTQFYVLSCSAPVTIKGQSGSNTTAANQFTTGQGQKVADGFEVLIVQNYNLFPVVALVWVGFDDFINDQLVLSNVTNPQVTYPTQPSSTAPPTVINIVDLSGQSFLDINGKKWLALFRVAIVICNFTTGTTMWLQKKGSAVVNGPAVLLLPPSLPIAHNSSGDFTISVGGGAVQCVVSEIYSAIPAN